MSEFVDIYTDGACRGNPGPGGWGVLMRWKGEERELCGWEAHTTNNRMEIMAVIRALQCLKKKVPVKIYTDSQYVKNGITRWIKVWKTNSWKTSNRKPVANIDLWQELDALVSRYDVEWHWVRGHVGHPENTRADSLANKGLAENGVMKSALDGMASYE